jgi:hypothetical protein
MDLLLENSYLKVQKVYSLMIKSTPVDNVVKKAIWWWQQDVTETKDSWTLEMEYDRDCGKRFIYTSKCADYSMLKGQFDSIMKQIKDQDSQYADKLLEDAIISGGSK